ncbi:MAG: Fumarylacetoacetate hydrolase family protein [Phycisphaerales bacterium]|nr:Fumarylacetoacetate hydrolase family protein [Phycisphaerales bacterium]
MRLYRTVRGLVVDRDGVWRDVPGMTWDDFLSSTDPTATVVERLRCSGGSGNAAPPAAADLLAPIGSQEVWAAGVTYLRSRDARKEEAKSAGGGDFYDRVYAADRPELFFKSTASRTVGPGGRVRLRGDSKWNVPEPELTLAVNPAGRIVGYTVGNDMSSRDIEGENPLYLPQAKVYDGSCALGPSVLLADPAAPLPPTTEIKLTIARGGSPAFQGRTSLSQIKRRFDELVAYLFRDQSFPAGVYLMTGTGVVPPDDFTLRTGDEVTIEIPPIGVLTNVVG